MTTTRRFEYVPALDGLRGIAIILVMLDHAEIRTFPGSGNVGVTLFFVLSGFLITTLLLEERERTGRIDLRAYLMRRGFRLLPALAVLVVVVSILMVLMGRATEIGGDVIPTLLYFMNWEKVAGEDPGLLSHAWSLGIEGQFYLVWPMALLGLLALTRRRPLTAAAIVGCVVVAIAVWRLVLWAPDSLDRVYWSTDTRADALLLGCALALLFRRHRVTPGSAAMALAALGLGAVTVFSSEESFALLGLTIVTMASGVLVAGAQSGSVAARVLAWRPLVYVGGISYGLYLFHRPIMRLGTSLGTDGALLPVAIMVVLSFAAAWLSWKYVESPVLRWSRHAAARNRTPVPTAPTLTPQPAQINRR